MSEIRYCTASEVAQMQADARQYSLWNSLAWGSYGKKGKDVKTVRVLGDLDTDHLEAILITQDNISFEMRAAILELLKIRYEE